MSIAAARPCSTIGSQASLARISIATARPSAAARACSRISIAAVSPAGESPRFNGRRSFLAVQRVVHYSAAAFRQQVVPRRCWWQLRRSRLFASSRGSSSAPLSVPGASPLGPAVVLLNRLRHAVLWCMTLPTLARCCRANLSSQLWQQNVHCRCVRDAVSAAPASHPHAYSALRIKPSSRMSRPSKRFRFCQRGLTSRCVTST
jgi:hypothetical protein